MPTPYPKEFRRDVIAVARQGDQSVAQVARSFGISESCLARWLGIAEWENDGASSAGSATAASGELEAENRELRRRTKQLEQENETSHAAGGSSRGWLWSGEGEGFVVAGARGQAVVQAAQESVEQVALRGSVPVTGGAAPVVVLACAG